MPRLAAVSVWEGVAGVSSNAPMASLCCLVAFAPYVRLTGALRRRGLDCSSTSMSSSRSVSSVVAPVSGVRGESLEAAVAGAGAWRVDGETRVADLARDGEREGAGSGASCVGADGVCDEGMTVVVVEGGNAVVPIVAVPWVPDVEAALLATAGVAVVAVVDAVALPLPLPLPLAPPLPLALVVRVDRRAASVSSSDSSTSSTSSSSTGVVK